MGGEFSGKQKKPSDVLLSFTDLGSSNGSAADEFCDVEQTA